MLNYLLSWLLSFNLLWWWQLALKVPNVCLAQLQGILDFISGGRVIALIDLLCHSVELFLDLAS